MIYDKDFPEEGQNVYVCYFTDGLILSDMVGKCVHTMWADESSTFTIVTEDSYHQFLLFSPLVLIVQVVDRDVSNFDDSIVCFS